MAKGEDTRLMIIEKSSKLFNQKGFAGTSMSDIMKSTQLKKGGIYNHFSSKEEIRLASFYYNFDLMKKAVNEIIKAKNSSEEKLLAMFDFYRDYALNPVIEGGCPIINSIIDSTQHDIHLREAVDNAIEQLLNSLIRIIKNGKRFNEFSDEVDEEKSAITIYSLIQGGILLSRGKNDKAYMNAVCDQLNDYITTHLKK